MDWVVRMNRALDYIEEHLAEKTNYTQIASAALTSAYHFPRMFVAITDLSLSEYIRRRRLSMAAQDLAGGEQVIDVAVKYGYESADAFARAFYRQHRMLPTQARMDGAQFTHYPKLSFHLTLQGDVPMNFRLEELDTLRIVGRRFTVDTRSAFDIVPAIWQREMEGGFLPKLIDMSWEKPKCKLESLLGIIGDKPRIDDDGAARRAAPSSSEHRERRAALRSDSAFRSSCPDTGYGGVGNGERRGSAPDPATGFHLLDALQRSRGHQPTANIFWSVDLFTNPLALMPFAFW
ncbi:MAG: AraC family transcriptional regulator [Christensenellaceae bacterium]|nr:AraC family transcriptional regulator [Christensenellaceae bacterium]